MRAAIHFLTLALFAAPAPALADDEAGNAPVVVASEHGNCYAKSVPAGAYGNEGRTTVYAVEAGADREIATYNWYAQRLRLACNVAGRDGRLAASIVQFGPWPRGRAANAETLAFAFHRDGVLLRRYSTLDVAGRPENVQASVSHYQVIDDILGYAGLDGNRYAFGVRTVDGRVLRYDAGTGEAIASGGGA
jgi:hypothetical protein